jgi:hypothetical protein
MTKDETNPNAQMTKARDDFRRLDFACRAVGVRRRVVALVIRHFFILFYSIDFAGA